MSTAIDEGEAALWQLATEELAAAEERNGKLLRVKSALVGAALLLTAATAISVALAAILAV